MKEKVFKPSVSKIIDLLFPFSLNEIAYSIQLEKKITWEKALKEANTILNLAIEKGNCTHNRAESYINNLDDLIGCDHIWTSPYNKKTYPAKSHQECWIKLEDKLKRINLDAKWISEDSFETEDLKGRIDFIIKEKDIIKVIDFKTQKDTSEIKWQIQLILYVYLINGSWDINWNNYEMEIWHTSNNKKAIKTTYKFTHNDNLIETLKLSIKKWYELFNLKEKGFIECEDCFKTDDNNILYICDSCKKIECKDCFIKNQWFKNISEKNINFICYNCFEN